MQVIKWWGSAAIFLSGGGAGAFGTTHYSEFSIFNHQSSIFGIIILVGRPRINQAGGTSPTLEIQCNTFSNHKLAKLLDGRGRFFTVWG